MNRFTNIQPNGVLLMVDITENILELVRLAATDLPPDVEISLKQALEREKTG